MKDFLIILTGILGATGMALVFAGNLFAIIVTMGKNKYLGIASFFVPLLPRWDIACVIERTPDIPCG